MFHSFVASLPKNPVLVHLILLNHWPGFSAVNSSTFSAAGASCFLFSFFGWRSQKRFGMYFISPVIHATDMHPPPSNITRTKHKHIKRFILLPRFLKKQASRIVLADKRRIVPTWLVLQPGLTPVNLHIYPTIPDLQKPVKRKIHDFEKFFPGGHGSRGCFLNSRSPVKPLGLVGVGATPR